MKRVLPQPVGPFSRHRNLLPVGRFEQLDFLADSFVIRLVFNQMVRRVEGAGIHALGAFGIIVSEAAGLLFLAFEVADFLIPLVHLFQGVAFAACLIHFVEYTAQFVSQGITLPGGCALSRLH